MDHEATQMPCELAAKSIIPSIRAAIAKVLVEEYGIPRYGAARLLNITPAAITNYIEGRRGGRFLERILSDPELMNMIREIGRIFAENLKNNGGRLESAEAEYERLVCTICSSVNPLIKDREAHLRQVAMTHGWGSFSVGARKGSP